MAFIVEKDMELGYSKIGFKYLVWSIAGAAVMTGLYFAAPGLIAVLGVYSIVLGALAGLGLGLSVTGYRELYTPNPAIKGVSNADNQVRPGRAALKFCVGSACMAPLLWVFGVVSAVSATAVGGLAGFFAILGGLTGSQAKMVKAQQAADTVRTQQPITDLPGELETKADKASTPHNEISDLKAKLSQATEKAGEQQQTIDALKVEIKVLQEQEQAQESKLKTQLGLQKQFYGAQLDAQRRESIAPEHSTDVHSERGADQQSTSVNDMTRLIAENATLRGEVKNLSEQNDELISDQSKMIGEQTASQQTQQRLLDEISELKVINTDLKVEVARLEELAQQVEPKTPEQLSAATNGIFSASTASRYLPQTLDMHSIATNMDPIDGTNI